MSQTNQTPTCSVTGRRFQSFLVSQFCEAIIDNIVKLGLSFLILEAAAGSKDTPLLFIANAAFLAPYLLFSPYAGYLADRFAKSTIIKVIKTSGIITCLVICLLFREKAIIPLVFMLFWTGLDSTMFSPAKYGLLPEILKPADLSRGNGHLEMWTFLAILAGTIISPQLFTLGENSAAITGYVVFVLGVIGGVTAWFVPRTAKPQSWAHFEINPFRKLFETFNKIRKERPLKLTFWAIVYFWFVGMVFQLNILLLAEQQLGLSKFATGALLSCFTIGIAIGSVFTGRVSEGKVELGLVPLGAIGLSVFFIFIGALPNYEITRFVGAFLLGFSGGMYIIPLNSFFQLHSPLAERGQYLACLNVFTFGGMFVGNGLLFVCQKLGLTPAQVFIVVGVLSIAATLRIVTEMPIWLARCVNWLLTHLVYRVRIVSEENIPHEGGGLIVCNHVTYTDPSILLASVDRPIRFMIYRPIYNQWYIKPAADIFGCIPLASEEDPKSIVRALNTARDAVNNGELVCIFAEGALTRHGHMLPFKKGLEKIMKGVDAPIIPVYIDQMWGSIFSFRDGKIIWKMPKQIPYPITLAFGKHLPGSSKAWEVRYAVQELSSGLFHFRRSASHMLHFEFVRTVCKYAYRTAVVDSSGRRLSYRKLLAAVMAVAALLKAKLNASTKMVAVLLPPSLGGALANIALMFAHKIPVNLNYTASLEAQGSAIKQCKIEKIITSRAVLKQFKCEESSQHIFIEDLLKEVTKFAWVKNFCQAALPFAVLKRIYKSSDSGLDTLATVIFSSGSTGEPKGVMLSHANITSNIVAIYELMQFRKGDAVMGVLPFFHSFGFTATLWMPLLAGLKAIYHYNPLDAETIGKLSLKEKPSMLFATPTFLLHYVRKIPTENFSSLRYVITGAEKLRESVADAFKNKFNVVPLEGYGATELSPVAMINVPDITDSVNYQVGIKLGTVGHPLPGVAVKIVDPDTFAPLAPDVEGLLLVKGPNVMMGYLNNKAKTKEVIKDGWYVTGDIAALDDDGFIRITDRLSRFSKIGGEMVPHIKIEEAVHSALASKEQVAVVMRVADEKRGEKLVVLHTIDLDAALLSKKLAEQGLPNLWIPKADAYKKIATLPLLGSGKLNLKELQRLAEM
ncbi:MAG: MFS transporter [Deltaproteobacteria bacterium]|nr:MFS transporter [Deltaproteobacteria bacterium]